MSKKLWGGRFSAATSADVDQYTASIGFDPELAQDDILGSLAHAAMLKHCSIIQSEDHAQLKSGLEYIAAAIKNNQVEFNVADEDIHMNIERLLGQHVGQVAGKLHTARSRNDQVALD
ncbi:MAG TPA: lyase family protein, partial [Gammaproteobacteria bacterium]|nr:lyase family protein [Gammaproteobacteria bacterium]